MRDLCCPYCDKELDRPDDCYEQDHPYQWTCYKCDKQFIFTITYYASYTATKADCLNGADHDFKPINGYPREYFKNKRACSMCDKEIEVKDE